MTDRELRVEQVEQTIAAFKVMASVMGDNLEAGEDLTRDQAVARAREDMVHSPYPELVDYLPF